MFLRKFFICCTGLVFLSCGVFALTPDEILKQVDRVRAPAETFVFNVKLTVLKEDGNSVNEFLVRVKNAKKSLVTFIAPLMNKGRVLLMVEDNLWIYIPNTRNPIRISPQQQLMGQVSNADVARVVYSLDYKADSMVEEMFDSQPALKLKLSAKTKGAAYGTIALWIKPDTFQPIKGEFYALSGRRLKTVYYKNYQDILGQLIPTVLEIKDEIQKSATSILEYSNFKLEDTPDGYFQKSFMERISRL
jgi:hypothetical protein